MKFNPKGLVVTAVFFGLLWVAIARGFDSVVLPAIVAVALDAAFGFGLLGFIVDRPWPWPRRSRVR